MNSSNYDVVVVGAGCAGLTAAIGMARAGFAVAVIEAAAYPGAENWSGCVYFCENLAHPDILGPEGVEALAWERRLVERGFFACDGHSLLGMTYRDPQAFRHCYTVLRPIYDHHLAQVAVAHGAALLANTTVESLIREGNQVIGVCTNRGPLYADLVFLAEGDASHLVTREGYERFTDQREAPKFLQGIKQVIELPPGAIESRFGVGPEDGVAYEMLLRNGTLRGKHVRLNMGGFVYTNRQSLSIGLVLPADNLHEHFAGDPNLLMEWFEGLPALKPWLSETQRGAFGAKIIRGGGAKDIPILVDNGLAIGGAASAIGVDFPYPNFTGPATAMGLLITQAAKAIRDTGGRFTRENLRRHYLGPLQRTHYWQDVDFLRRWPGYVKKTRTFFGRNLDLALGSAYIWTRPKRWSITKWLNWLRMMMHVCGPQNWGEMQDDMRHLSRALRLRTVVTPPNLGRLLLDGTVNALRDICGRPRANLPPAGTIRLHYAVAGGAEPAGMAPALLRRWFNRFALILAPAAKTIYANDTTPLADKLKTVAALLVKQVNMLDLIGAACLSLATAVGSTLLTGWDRFLGFFRKGRPKAPGRIYPGYALAARKAADMTGAVESAAQHWEERLGRLAYQTVRPSHIHVHWPKVLSEKNDIVRSGLWHVCPAHVYEARVSPLGQLQLVVNFENCIKCETCWRTSNLVDWGRDGRHRFIYPVHSPALARLIDGAQAASQGRSTLPRNLDAWEPALRELAGLGRQAFQPDVPTHVRLESLTYNGRHAREVAELDRLLTSLDKKLEEFDLALEEEPRTIDRSRAEYLEMLARYAYQLAVGVVEILRGSLLATSQASGIAAVYQRLLQLATALTVKAEERSRRTWDQRYAWAAADGRQLRWHHVAGLRRAFLLLGAPKNPALTSDPDPVRAWLKAEENSSLVAGAMAAINSQLDRAFPSPLWRDRERQIPLTSEQDSVLRDILAHVPALDPANLPGSLHPPLRKAILAELGRRDPSLAYRAASHLWARDLARLATVSSPLAQSAQKWTRGDEWACFAILERTPAAEGDCHGEAFFIPAAGAKSLLALWEDRLFIRPTSLASQETVPEKGSDPLNSRGQTPFPEPGLAIEALGTLGLRGAGLTRVRVADPSYFASAMRVDPNRIRRIWSVLSAADLTSIAYGMADQLCKRAISHTTNRVQFPGLFHDEEARDPIGKFGAVKKMVAEMATARYMIQTVDHCLSPIDFSSSSVERARLLKGIVAEALGTAPGSLSYNAGQVFGGTGYSEDDILAKFYRDAAAWRFLGPANGEVFLQHGEDLLQNWRSDGQRLATLREEAHLFEEVAQRKALQAELDGVRVLRSRLRTLIGEWQAAHRTLAPGSGASPLSMSAIHEAALAEIGDHLGRQDALMLVTKALLLRTHARLERGLSSEIETALIRVWLDRTLAALDEFDSVVRNRLEAAATRHDRPVVEPSVGPPVTRYADFLAAPLPYDSGDFLCQPVDLAQPRYVPEMNETDADLAAWDQHIKTLLLDQFGKRDGLVYERYIERQHRPDAADLDFCRRHGFFRMPIPNDLGGEGRRKVDYYLLTTNAQRLVDVAISLTIQANTSIGTTPVLLARDKDLPKAQKDLGPFVGDTSLQQEVQRGLQALLALFDRADPRRIETAYRALQQRLGETVFSRTVLKSLAHRFVESWQQAGRAGLEFNLSAMRAHLQEALVAWNYASTQAPELHAELGRRREACELFLRWVASGQISAFALTEPSAGSDTARVATRARLRSVPVQVEADGALRFVPEGGKESCYLLDARRLVFRPEGVCYRWSDQAGPAIIHFDEYDYETDDPERMRYYDHGPRRVHFTDIAQLRERSGRLWYDYYELTGAKMWITNGRMAGIMCLYAKTDQGVTGFIVDRHAPGLIVGKDEAKLGQCGSPTNELSLQAVRVPRENVLGLEGRGQVNALETLNVGRAGLAMSAMAQMPGLIAGSRSFAEATYGTIPDWAAWRLERMEEDCFTAQALAHEVIGRFEHPQTRSVRMESAIAKMLASELLHRLIETAEEIHGLAGQTTLHLVEKRKRDARILNIYEGTNEVQRFSILKDLAAEVAPRWKQSSAAAAPRHLGREVLELEALKTGARQRIEAALDLFGQDLWQNPNLQANCFLLAEAVAWLAAAESTLGRLAWLTRQNPIDDSAEPAPRVELGHRALVRCGNEVRHRLRRFDEDLTHLRRGYYAPEIRAASLLFDQLSKTSEGPKDLESLGLSCHITRSLSILVVVEPSAAAVPHPYVVDGGLLEPHLTLHDGDRSALEMALRLRDAASAPVAISVVAVGPRRTAAGLREALSLGVDRVRLLAPEAEAVTSDSAATALVSILRHEGPFDVVLTGSNGPAGEEGLLGRLTAEALEVPFAGSAIELALRASQEENNAVLHGADQQNRVRALPIGVTIEPGLQLRPFTTAGYLAGLSRNVEFTRWPKKIEARPVMFLEPKPTAARAGQPESPHALQPKEAGRWLLDSLGLGGDRSASREVFTGPIQEVDQPSFPGRSGLPSRTGPARQAGPTRETEQGPSWVLALLGTDASGNLHSSAEATVQAARLIARTEEDPAVATVALVVPAQEQAQRQALAQLRPCYQGDVLLLPLRGAETSDEVKCRLLAESMAQLAAFPLAVVGEPWTEPAFAKLATRQGQGDGIVCRVCFLGGDDGRLVLETSLAKGKLRLRQGRVLPLEHTCWISLAEDAEVAPVEPGPACRAGQGQDGSGSGRTDFKSVPPSRTYLESLPPSFRVERWAPQLDRLYGRGDIQHLLNELRHETGLASLADADFIIDVGFGVGSRDGYEAVIEPLERALRDLGVQNVVIGGSRKVTEELHLLPAKCQIGQSGVNVNPRILLAIGISGAPQHVNYIGGRAKILAFNRDPEAPLMTLNQRQPSPKVYPVVGDLFETIPALIAALRQETAGKGSLSTEQPLPTT